MLYLLISLWKPGLVGALIGALIAWAIGVSAGWALAAAACGYVVTVLVLWGLFAMFGNIQ